MGFDSGSQAMNFPTSKYRHAVGRKSWSAILVCALVTLCRPMPLCGEPTGQFVADYSLRNADFPKTFIESIEVDLTSPRHWVRLTWAGPRAEDQEIGPFRSSPGRGLGYNNCDDEDESKRDGSNCTPKGTRPVEGFSDFLRDSPDCRYVTWFHIPRAIAFHSHSNVPDYPASHGCVRMKEHAAHLIHNNSIKGKTKVIVVGTWTSP
jgi:hypothetical protein